MGFRRGQSVALLLAGTLLGAGATASTVVFVDILACDAALMNTPDTAARGSESGEPLPTLRATRFIKYFDSLEFGGAGNRDWLAHWEERHQMLYRLMLEAARTDPAYLAQVATTVDGLIATWKAKDSSNPPGWQLEQDWLPIRDQVRSAHDLATVLRQLHESGRMPISRSAMESLRNMGSVIRNDAFILNRDLAEEGLEEEELAYSKKIYENYQTRLKTYAAFRVWVELTFGDIAGHGDQFVPPTGGI